MTAPRLKQLLTENRDKLERLATQWGVDGGRARTVEELLVLIRDADEAAYARAQAEEIAASRAPPSVKAKREAKPVSQSLQSSGNRSRSQSQSQNRSSSQSRSRSRNRSARGSSPMLLPSLTFPLTLPGEERSRRNSKRRRSKKTTVAKIIKPKVSKTRPKTGRSGRVAAAKRPNESEGEEKDERKRNVRQRTTHNVEAALKSLRTAINKAVDVLSFEVVGNEVDRLLLPHRCAALTATKNK